jgi:broad specificity phosphatase PhoE
MQEEIKKHPVNAKLALIIRHGDRAEIPDGTFGNEILLNNTGITNAKLFGKRLQERKINGIYSSPIQRCIQTSEYIIEGLEKHVNINVTKALGDPGLHTDDEKLAGEFYLKYKFDEMYRRFMINEPIPGVPSPQDFERKMTDFITQNTKEEGITIFVTHDSLIAFYHYCLNKKVYTQDNWVNYLSGIVLKVA